MNFPTNKPSQGGVGNAGGVCIGVQGAPSAQSFNEHAYATGTIQFQPHWSNTEDSMAASIIRLECEADELRAGAALAEAERIEMAKMLRSEREAHAACQNERDELRELLAEIVFWIEGDLRDEVDASYRKAVERAQKLTEGIR